MKAMPHANVAAPSRNECEQLITLVNAGRVGEAEVMTRRLVNDFPLHGFGWKVLGVVLQMQGRSIDALEPLRTAAKLLPNDAEAHSNLGAIYSDLQQWSDAAESQRRAIRLQPRFANAHFNLGLALLRMNEFAAAEQSFRRASQLQPKWAECLFELAASLAAQDKHDAAITAYRQALQSNPRMAEAHNNLGNLLKDRQRFDEARACYESAIAIAPDYAEAFNNLGIVRKLEGDADGAQECYRTALRLQPQFAEAHYNLGIAFAEQKKFSDAEQCYRNAVEIRPDYVDAYNNLGNVLNELRKFPEAESMLRRATALAPHNVAAHCNLGNALRGQHRLAEAERSYREANRLNPNLAEAIYNLGISQAEQYQLAMAEQSYRRALELQPNYAEAHKNLGNVCKELGRFAEAEACYREALRINPDYIDAQSNLLFDLNYCADRDSQSCVAEARHFGAMATRLAARPFVDWRCAMSPTRLKVGFVSGDLHAHPVAFFIEAMLRELDRARVHVTAYSAHHESDAVTLRLREQFDDWRSVLDLSDADAAQVIANDGIHVLIDLSGHTARNRLPLFAYKPAPIQASWLGYFATTGIEQMDFLIGDPHVTPEHEEHHFVERVWRLPESYLCFTAPHSESEATMSTERVDAGGFTFGCFNNLAKMTDKVVTVWSAILNAVPDSRLLLKTRQLDDSDMCERTIARFEEHGVQSDRLILEGSATRDELLRCYRRVDIALDPFPYPGGTTSVEALWMGVPVLTRKGDRFISHVGETIAKNVAAPEWIARDDEDYIHKAIAFAAQRQTLSLQRASRRDRVLRSPLFDAPRFARHFTDAVWSMWNGRKL